MLPLIEVQANELCKTGFSPHTGRVEPIGDTYWFDWQTVAKAVQSQGMNLDRFLTLRLVSFFARRKPRSNVLICYTPYQDRFVLSVCSKQNISLMDALHVTSGMPGNLDYGQDYLPPTAAPFVFYGGMQLYRLYGVQERPDSAYCVCDFGNLFGMCVEESDPDSYKRIREEPDEHVDYSPIPVEPSEDLDFNGINVILQHAFCRWRRNPTAPSAQC